MSHASLIAPELAQPPSLPVLRPLLSKRDALAGAAGGTVSVLLGQPFDLIKVRLQTANSSNVLKVAKDVVTHEGFRAFYKGATLPFLGVGASVSIQFSVFHSARQAFEGLNEHRTLPRQGMSNSQAYFAGAAAGVANSFISGPIEHIRTRMQLDRSVGSARQYVGSIDCVRKVFAEAGIAGLYKAWPMAIAREFQAYGCYFATFEACIRGLMEVRQRERRDLSVWEVAPCGALAGIAFWIGSYPIDVIKSRQQADGFGSKAKFSGPWEIAKDTWRQGRFLGFWRGLSPTLIRTSLSSAGCFATVEQVRKWV